MKRRPILCCVAFLWLATAAGAQTDSARITYTKEFPGSQPGYVSLSVQQDGQCSFRTAPGEKPVQFQISQHTAEQIFTLAQRLNFFQGPSLESKRKVAQMGKKTLTYEKGGESHSESFNYTDNPTGVALTSLLERLSRTEWRRDQLEYALRFDPLGIMDELLQTESDLDHSQLLEPELLVPILQTIQSNGALIHIAQERAAEIAVKIHSAKP